MVSTSKQGTYTWMDNIQAKDAHGNALSLTFLARQRSLLPREAESQIKHVTLSIGLAYRI